MFRLAKAQAIIVLSGALVAAGTGFYFLRPHTMPPRSHADHSAPPRPRFFCDVAREAGITFRMQFLPAEQGEKFKINLYDREQAKALQVEHAADAIVNCSGLGARELSDRSVNPLRGALIRVRNDGQAVPRITQAHCISQNGSDGERGFIFIVPRGDDMLVLGGFAEQDEWALNIGLHNYEPIREMYRRCLELMPALRNAKVDAAEPVRVGLRPYRSRGVRLEREAGTCIIHNYGHGGSGVTLSWGCALEVVDRIEQEHVTRLVEETASAG